MSISFPLNEENLSSYFT